MRYLARHSFQTTAAALLGAAKSRFLMDEDGCSLRVALQTLFLPLILTSEFWQ